ncbi:MAG: 2-oxoglutarate dehydrogenase E1 component, partial [Gemmatimonadota bacterium]|nr:2-oxoglutarate dehydrogenase E1 component [Gemmatimonadota bacterium]
MALPRAGVFNDGLIAEQWERYQRDPASVDESWRQYFGFAQSLGGGATAPAGASDSDLLRKVAAAAGLVAAIRAFGHLAFQRDPLGTLPGGTPELTPEFHGITEEDLGAVPGSALGFEQATARDVVAHLRHLYSTAIGLEFEHLGRAAEREWLRTAVESGSLHEPLSSEDQVGLLRRLTEVDGLERFLGRAYQGYKRFSIEGTDALVPMLDEVIRRSAADGAREIAMGMAHRGRINVLAHILGKPYTAIFAEFEGKHAATNSPDGTGDVKYHMGARGEFPISGGNTVAVTLVPNPSHLEFVNPVLTGVARALQRRADVPGEHDESTIVPVCIHGDAAFPGEGVVAETLNLSRLRGYRVGGTIHVIVNNQIGFTTDSSDGRSTRFAGDLAKGYEVPIAHVNADDAASCVLASRLAVAYRTKFAKDFLINLVGYRRHGHNETDEPSFTQPVMYARIRSHPTARQVWAARLVQEGLVSEAQVSSIEADVNLKFEEAHAAAQADEDAAEQSRPNADAGTAVPTAVPAEQLVALNERLLTWPEKMKVNPRLAKNLARRRDAMGDSGGIDWGHAEALAFASIVTDGTSIRFSGQDVERGTFSHRQAVLHDSDTNETYVPLQHLPDAKGAFEIHNSALSETAVLGFEYGFSTAAPDVLVLWEAQFGDFVNVAQPIIDQFISSDHAKWGQDSSVTMLLPHGYEGQGPEHSSARLERFLQLCAESNMRVAYPSTPAQYFHILRRQARQAQRRPLVLMQPKSLLRMPEAASRLGDLADGSFRTVLDDPARADGRDQVKRLVFCTGKIYYDLLAGGPPPEVALIRVEELYPWPHEEVTRVVDAYANVSEVVWAQEEPKNMGAWTYVAPLLRVSTGD